jgi:hypothetical protein
MASPPGLEELLEGRHVNCDIIVRCVRWYLRATAAGDPWGAAAAPGLKRSFRPGDFPAPSPSTRRRGNHGGAFRILRRQPEFNRQVCG